MTTWVRMQAKIVKFRTAACLMSVIVANWRPLLVVVGGGGGGGDGRTIRPQGSRKESLSFYAA